MMVRITILFTLIALISTAVLSANINEELLKRCQRRAAVGKPIGKRCQAAELSQGYDKEVCPRKPHLTGGRTCKRACVTDADCKGRKKRCVCDDVCGLTCLNPRGKCPSLELVNGKVRISGRNQLGAVAKHSCSKGYELQGQEIRICNGDREWSGTAPRCMPVSQTASDRNLRDPIRDRPQNMDSGSEIIGRQALCPEPPRVDFADHDGPKQSTFVPGSDVTYSCRNGYRLDGIGMARCMTNGNWAGPLMKCLEVSCPDLGDISQGVRYGDAPFTFNSKINYECNKGYRLAGSPTLTCKKDGMWDSGKPSCQKISADSCPKVKSPRHGLRIGRSYSIGSVVTVVCDAGYQVNGTTKRICRDDATWSGVEPTCQPIDCGDPGDLPNGYVVGKRFTYGSVVKYRCMDGTKFEGLALSATCLENGQWSFPPPKCLRSCARPQISNAEIFLKSEPAPMILEHATELSVVCGSGLAPSNTAAPICNNGTWSFIPTCIQGGCDSRPKEIANGIALYRGTRYGDRVRYMCNTGYKLIGDKYLVCEGGVWKGRIPSCNPVYCDHPGELENGKILLVGDIGKFEYRPYVRRAGQGEKIEYYCSAGYRLKGSSASTCIDGVWSPEDNRPTCESNQHPDLPDSQELFTT